VAGQLLFRRLTGRAAGQHERHPNASARLSVPTLILHAKDDRVWRFSEAEELHALVPGSRLVELDSNNHILRADEPAFDRLLHEEREFLATDDIAIEGQPH
jgi:pimeloyl-ACP methyl ester carboxylesterase